MGREVIGIIATLWSLIGFAGETELKFYQALPENSDNTSVTIIAKTAGECSQQSQRIKREDAWLCTAEGKTYDPCFEKGFGVSRSVVCFEAPWSNKAMEITLNQPLDASQNQKLDMSSTFPWALELASGEKCTAVDTSAMYDELPIHYRCEGQSELMGPMQRCENTWKMLQHGVDGVKTVQIARAWF